MADKFPSTFVDEKTGEIKKFETLWDKVQDGFPDAAHYGLLAAKIRPNGKDPVVIMGRGALGELNPEEMRAVIGHEFTHVKLGHMRETANWLGRFSMSSAVNVGLFAAGLLGGLPMLPVLAIVA